MKKLLKISFAFLLALGLNSCSDDVKNELTENAATGGLLDIETTNVAYIQGSDAVTDFFTIDLSVFQGNEKVESVDVYKQFFRQVDAATLVESNKVMFTTFNFPVMAQHEEHQISFNYNDLIADLVYEAAPLPADDSMLEIADYWIFTYVAHLTDGTSVHINVKNTKVTVSCGSFLAGNYLVNYTSGPEIFIVTAKGGGLYEMNTMLAWRASHGYVTEFTDVCGDLDFINPWYFASYTVDGTGTVQPNGDILWTDVSVSTVYSGRTYLMIKQ